MFDWSAELHDLRHHSLEWLHEARAEAVREERRWHLRRLAITRILDERHAIDDATATADGVSVREVRESVETARMLDELPQVAAAAAEGHLSATQLASVVHLADAATDAEWAARAPQCAPADLARMVRARRTPTVEESRRRWESRELRFWWDARTGMCTGRFALPDLAGAAFESAIDQICERLRPEPGRPWAPRPQRAADALIALVERAQGHTDGPAAGIVPKVVVQVPPTGPAEVVGPGVLLADETVEQLRANASIEAVLCDEHGAVITVGRAHTALPAKTTRVVRARDGHCRWPGCGEGHGLQVHHMVPRSWGGTDAFDNLVSVCARHHRLLVPHGELVLTGNPNRPDGLSLERAAHRPDHRSSAARAP